MHHWTGTFFYVLIIFENNESLFSKAVEFSMHSDAINNVPSVWMSDLQFSTVQVIEFNSVYVFYFIF